MTCAAWCQDHDYLSRVCSAQVRQDRDGMVILMQPEDRRPLVHVFACGTGRTGHRPRTLTAEVDMARQVAGLVEAVCGAAWIVDGVREAVAQTELAEGGR